MMMWLFKDFEGGRINIFPTGSLVVVVVVGKGEKKIYFFLKRGCIFHDVAISDPGVTYEFPTLSFSLSRFSFLEKKVHAFLFFYFIFSIRTI
jgi:hypothetical protein